MSSPPNARSFWLPLRPVPDTIHALLKQPMSHAANSLIEQLPTEILQHIAAFLTLDAAALLALCSRMLAVKLGVQYWAKIRPIDRIRQDLGWIWLRDQWLCSSEAHPDDSGTVQSQSRGRYLLHRSWASIETDNPHHPPEYLALENFFILLQRDLPCGWYYCSLCISLHLAQIQPAARLAQNRACHIAPNKKRTPYPVYLYDEFTVTVPTLLESAAQLRRFGTAAQLQYSTDFEGSLYEFERAMAADVEMRVLTDGHVVVRTQEWHGCDAAVWQALADSATRTLENAMDIVRVRRRHALCPHDEQMGYRRLETMEPVKRPRRSISAATVVSFACPDCATEVRVDFWRFPRRILLANRNVTSQEDPARGRALVLTVWRDLGDGRSARHPAWRAQMLETHHPAYPAAMQDGCWLGKQGSARCGGGTTTASPMQRFEQHVDGASVAQLERKLLKKLRGGTVDKSTLAHRAYGPLVKLRYPLDWPLSPPSKTKR